MSEIRDWLTTRYPDAMPWQVACAEAAVSANREGRRLVVSFSRGCGKQATARMAEECRAAFVETGDPR